jgi:hypothetical protein
MRTPCIAARANFIAGICTSAIVSCSSSQAAFVPHRPLLECTPSQTHRLPDATQEPIMIDRILTPLLAFAVLIGSTLAIATAWFDSRSTVRKVALPAVQIIVKRAAPSVDLASAGATEATAGRLQ